MVPEVKNSVKRYAISSAQQINISILLRPRSLFKQKQKTKRTITRLNVYQVHCLTISHTRVSISSTVQLHAVVGPSSATDSGTHINGDDRHQQFRGTFSFRLFAASASRLHTRFTVEFSQFITAWMRGWCKQSSVTSSCINEDPNFDSDYGLLLENHGLQILVRTRSFQKIINHQRYTFVTDERTDEDVEIDKRTPCCRMRRLDVFVCWRKNLQPRSDSAANSIDWPRACSSKKLMFPSSRRVRRSSVDHNLQASTERRGFAVRKYNFCLMNAIYRLRPQAPQQQLQQSRFRDLDVQSAARGSEIILAARRLITAAAVILQNQPAIRRLQ
jgi:hypothetical protein